MKRLALFLTLTFSVGITVPVSSAAAQAGKVDTKALGAAVERWGDHLCAGQVYVSAVNRNWAVTVSMPSDFCSGSVFDHIAWQKRAGEWVFVELGSGRIEEPFTCFKSKRIPKDLRCNR
jgi:hypothetical protein